MAPDGPSAELPRLRDVVVESGSGWYPLLALGGLVVTGAVGGHALLVLLPEIGRTVGIGAGGLAAILTGQALLSALVSLPLARMVQRRPARGLLAAGGASAGAALLLATAVSIRPAELAVALLGVGAAGAVVAVTHQPLVAELYPPAGRVRALAVLRGARGVGQVAAPFVVGLLVTMVGLTWRGVFVVAAALVGLASMAAVGLRDPGHGRWELGASGHGPVEAGDDLGIGEAARRLQAIPTLRRLFIFQAGLGAMLVPFAVFLALFLELRWGLGPGGRGAVLSAMGLAAVVAVAAFGRSGERLFREDPAGLVRLATGLWGGAVVLVVAAALAPTLAVVVLALASASGLVAAIAPGLAILHLSLVPPRLRSVSTALAGAWFAGLGGPLGILLFGSADRRYGLAGALALTTIPGLVAVAVLRAARHTVVTDLGRAQTELDRHGSRDLGPVAPPASRTPRSVRRRTRPALVVRGVTAGYDGRAVIEDVDVVVEAGERVALVGANGVGKTTLLHALAGLVPMQAGTVHVGGRELTHWDADRRPAAGLVMVAGPTAVFDPLTVDDHLRLYAGRSELSSSDVPDRVAEVWRRFPGLAARRTVRARDLSGGERRMLGLARAVLVRPTALLVDELTLGLAADVRDQVVEMIGGIATAGTAVLFVDQSVGVARAVADRVVLLTDGRVGFDGPVSDLDARLLPARYLRRLP